MTFKSRAVRLVKIVSVECGATTTHVRTMDSILFAVLHYLRSSPVALILTILAIVIATVWFASTGPSKKTVSSAN